jgi:hypothetical protein
MHDEPMCLLFAAIQELNDKLDEACTDPALTTYILAIRHLSQRGFDLSNARDLKH